MCEITIPVKCPYCHGLKVVKNGRKPYGAQNFLCRHCGKQFQYHYQKAGCRPEMKTLVLKLLVRNTGIRDIEAVLGIHRQTVLKWLNQAAAAREVIPRQKQYTTVQIDELWTFVKERKKKKRWLLYAYAPETDEILAWSWGRRSAKTVKNLYAQLKELAVEYFCTDDWKAFAQVLPAEKHLIGKAYTRHIEGVNLCLRTRNRRVVRKTACFSKKQANHDNAMKLVFYYRNHHTL
jgi:IS1 family transposase/transposase-like protein